MMRIGMMATEKREGKGEAVGVNAMEDRQR
jgi:hypothetical protein